MRHQEFYVDQEISYCAQGEIFLSKIRDYSQLISRQHVDRDPLVIMDIISYEISFCFKPWIKGTLYII